MAIVQESVRTGYLHLDLITPARFELAKALRLRFRDKPRISFTDLTTMVVMQEREIAQILTEDEHFTHVGLGLQIAP